jgi:hypothetical protein
LVALANSLAGKVRAERDNCEKTGSRWFQKRLKTPEINNLFGIELSGTYPEVPKRSWHDSPGIHQTFRTDWWGGRISTGHPVAPPHRSIEGQPSVASTTCNSIQRTAIVGFRHEARLIFVRSAPPFRSVRRSCPSTWCNFGCGTGLSSPGGLGCNL